jgi:nucleoside-diphosphate-sugar epimerase
VKVLVTGSAGHLGEGLARTLKEAGNEVVGLDIRKSPFTTHVGSITDRGFVRFCLRGAQTVFHTATFHKPHVATHSRQEFIDTNITGTLGLLEEAVAASVEAFVFTSTTSVFGDALVPPAEAPAAWVTEDLTPVPKNIYGVTKAAAEDLCQLFYRDYGLCCIVLRTSRFFPEEDDDREIREAYADQNLKANEYLFRRVDLEDAVNAHLLAAERARQRSGSADTLSVRPRHFRRTSCQICVRMRPGRCGVMSLNTRPHMSVAVGKCCRASTGFMSTNEHDASSIGNRNTTSSTSLTASNQAMICEALLHGSSGQRDIVPR